MVKQLELSWVRFASVVILISAFPAVLVAFSISDRDAWAALATVWIAHGSAVIFCGLGWARLRRANSVSPIPASDLSLVVRHFIGPLVPAVVWSGLTLVAVLVVVIIGLLT